MRYAHPGSEGAIVSFKARYGNYICLLYTS
ncbi:hypothetical protein, partial [Pseudomonas aeruginosa]